MKFAIPTNDGLNLCHDFGQAKGFLILTYELGEITGEEMRWNRLSDVLCSPDGFLTPMVDCDAIMVNEIGPTYTRLVKERSTEIIRTKESIITNAWIHYHENSLLREADTCCCP
jgi:predicted Fe-Mo cluster-binding NifX family protein